MHIAHYRLKMNHIKTRKKQLKLSISFIRAKYKFNSAGLFLPSIKQKQ